MVIDQGCLHHPCLPLCAVTCIGCCWLDAKASWMWLFEVAHMTLLGHKHGVIGTNMDTMLLM